MSDKHLFKFYCGDSNDRWFDHESRLDSMEDAVKEGMSMFDKSLHSRVDDDGDDITVILSVHCTALREAALPVFCDCVEDCPESCDGYETYIEIVDETALDAWVKSRTKVKEDAQ